MSPMSNFDAGSALDALAEQQQQLARLEAELAEEKHSVRSADGRIEVTVNGLGALSDLVIAPGSLRIVPADQLGAQIVATIHAARAAAGERAQERLISVLPNFA